MKVAYADPPYLGCCSRYDHEHGISGQCWDDIATHERLIDDVVDAYPDGWAMSVSSPSLRQILPLCPDDVRVAAWVKPFAVFKPNVNPAYAWEPLIWRGGRSRRSRSQPTARDWVAAGITLQKGLVGAKPEKFCWWLIELLGLQPDDEFDDLFPGTGIVSAVWLAYQRQSRLFDQKCDAALVAEEPPR